MIHTQKLIDVTSKKNAINTPKRFKTTQSLKIMNVFQLRLPAAIVTKPMGINETVTVTNAPVKLKLTSATNALNCSTFTKSLGSMRRVVKQVQAFAQKEN